MMDSLEQEGKMQIEAGKFYRSRGGKRVGPMVRTSGLLGPDWPWTSDQGLTYSANGRQACDLSDAPADLIAEWSDDAPAPTDELATLGRIIDAFDTLPSGAHQRVMDYLNARFR